MIDKEKIVAELKKIYDPEIPVNIWDLGLVYDIDILPNEIIIKMTFTSPTCPMMADILDDVRTHVECASGGMPVRVELVWDPPWNLDMMSDAARIELDLTNAGW